MAAVRGLAQSLLGTGHTRLKLLGNELHTAKLRILRQLGFAVALIFCAGLAVLLAVALLVVLFWDQRVAVLSLLLLVFIVLGGFFYNALRRTSEDSENVFAASLAELQEDLRQLKANTAAHEKKPG